MRLVALGAVAVLILTAASAALAEATVVVTSTELKATDQKAKFTATNLTADPIPMAVGELTLTGCDPTLDPPDLDEPTGVAAVPTEVTVTLTGCDLDDDLTLPVLFGGSETRFTITEDSEPTVDSGLLGHWFLHAVIWSASVILIAAFWRRAHADASATPPPGSPGFRKLYGIEPGWKFKDSWASNVTIVSSGLALFVASSETMKAVLGSSAEKRLGTIVVGSAIAAALVAISPIAALVSRELGGEGQHVTQWGLALGAFITLTGTIGEILLLRGEGKTLTEGWISDAIGIAGMVGVAAVAVYGVASLIRLLGLTKEPDKKPSEAEAAAKVIAAAILASRPPPVDLAPATRSAMEGDLQQTAGELQSAIDSLIDLRSDTTNEVAPRASSL